ncbi:unnamed protein product [Rotaria sordida]|uniref:G-protein coupled receptors family 1 profile domain-containing protein n=1 Tax=Rotaria sordida TaxID=392033 RepID=A0A814WZ63_9BILA|nr:unnamed protein product [Rotaria sordida]CAF1208523.1 unnamed protein product [Rotaria sordida]
MFNLNFSSSTSSSLTVVRHSLAEPSNSSSTAIRIVNEQNSTLFNTENFQPSIRIMWYRFLLVIIIFVTAAGNLLVCLAIARERKLQNTTNYFLMSLAIADCLVAILVMPMGMVSEVFGHFPLPHSACIIFATMDVLCCTSSIWHMSTMSMDRYFTIRFPFRYGRNKTRRIMFLKIVAVWAISAAVSSPIFVLGIVNEKNVLSEGICAPNNASFRIYGSIFAFYIPFIIMITTYALTMRSLRNVLVNKKKYNRERRQKQTFRPLAQIIHQYAEIAQGIRRTSSGKKQTIQKTTTTNNNNNNNNNNSDNNSILNKTLYTIKKATSLTDSRTSLFSINNTNINLQQDNNSKDMINEVNINNDPIHHNSQHLTISYIKPSGSRNRCYQQQILTMNTAMHRKENGIDMSTVYEITEYSKSTSSLNDISAVVSNNACRLSIVNNGQQISEQIDKIEQLENSNLIKSTINDTSTLEEEEPSSISDTDSKTDVHESVHMQIASPSFQQFALYHPTEPIFLKIPWKYCFEIIQYILQYYIFYFPYRLQPLSIEYSSNLNKKSLKVNQSTSISSFYITPIKYHRTVSTQTTSFSNSDSPNINPTNVNEHGVYNASKQRKFRFNRSVLPSSSLLTNFFRHTPTSPVRSSGSSSKSSFSSGQRSSALSSSNQIRQPYPINHFSRMESELEPILTTDSRSRTSTSSCSFLHTPNRHESHIFTRYHKPLRRQYQYRSGYMISNSFKTRQQHQQFSSPTMTNSSDSSSMMYNYPSRLFSKVPSQQRINDEDIVAANERKALRVLMIIFCVFVTLWTPFFICTFISGICQRCHDNLSSTVWFSITWLGYSSSMANPFIYTIFSDVFRRAFINIIFCRSAESLISGRHSAKFSYQKDGGHHSINQRLSFRRSRNHDVSGASTPILHHRPTLPSGSDGKIYMNRCTSETFR